MNKRLSRVHARCTQSVCGRWTGCLLHPLISQEKDKHSGFLTGTNHSHNSMLLSTHSTYHFTDVDGEPSVPNYHHLVHQIQARHLQDVLFLPISSIFNLNNQCPW